MTGEYAPLVFGHSPDVAVVMIPLVRLSWPEK